MLIFVMVILAMAMELLLMLPAMAIMTPRVL